MPLLFEQIEFIGVTDVGIRRSHNQDAYAIQKASDEEHFRKVGFIFLVADGMGGHAVGEKASARAAQQIPLTFVKYVHESPDKALRKAIENANTEIHGIGTSNPEFKGLGTTATCLVLREDGAWVGHVGDSRVYRIRTGKTQQLSFDHSYVWEMARRLRVPPEELSDVKKNVIIRSLGPDSNVQVDVEGPHPLEPGDAFVLCSDGLSNMVTPEEVGAIVASLPIQESADFLVRIANLRGGPDNITVIIVRIGHMEPSVATMITPPPGLLTRMFRTLGYRIRRILPWPMALLILGMLSAVGFLAALVDLIPGKWGFATLSGLLLIGGLIGMLIQSRQRKQMEAGAGRQRKLNIYRTYQCPVQPSLVEKFRKVEAQLKTYLQANNVPVPWEEWRMHNQMAEAAVRDSDLVIAFRETCRGLSILAKHFNQIRQKDEGFRPKWEAD